MWRSCSWCQSLLDYGFLMRGIVLLALLAIPAVRDPDSGPEIRVLVEMTEIVVQPGATGPREGRVGDYRGGEFGETARRQAVEPDEKRYLPTPLHE